MNEQILLILIVLIITLLILWQGYKINDFNVEGIIFGVRVPEKYRENDKALNVIKQYNKRITILTLVDLIAFLSIFYYIQKVYIIIIYLYALVFFNLHSYYLARKKLIVVKRYFGWEKQSENKIYIQIGRKKEDGEISLKLFYMAGVIAILGFLIMISKLSSLPKMVPIHFGINGPDNWVDSTTIYGKLQVILLPVVSIVCIWTMYFSAKIQARKDSSKFNGGTISSLLLKKSLSIKSMTMMLGLISLGVSLIVFYGVLLVIGVIQFENSSNYAFMAATIGVILFPLTYWISSTKSIKELKVESDLKEKEIYNDDDKYYIGGIFYYNPNDPSNIVKKRMGYGLDFNYGRTFGKIIALFQIIILIGMVIGMITLNI